MSQEPNSRLAPLGSVIGSCNTFTIPSHKAVLITMYSFGNTDGSNIRADVKTIAERVPLELRQTAKIIQALKKEGYLVETGRSSYRNIAIYSISRERLLTKNVLPANKPKPRGSATKTAKKSQNTKNETVRSNGHDASITEVPPYSYPKELAPLVRVWEERGEPVETIKAWIKEMIP